MIDESRRAAVALLMRGASALPVEPEADEGDRAYPMGPAGGDALGVAEPRGTP